MCVWCVCAFGSQPNKERMEKNVHQNPSAMMLFDDDNNRNHHHHTSSSTSSSSRISMFTSKPTSKTNENDEMMKWKVLIIFFSFLLPAAEQNRIGKPEFFVF